MDRKIIFWLSIVFLVAVLVMESDLPVQQKRNPEITSLVADSTQMRTDSSEARGGTEQAWVKRTVDGDTLDVIVEGREEKVRLIGINSPESVDPRRPVECYGKEASKKMDLLATHHQVTMTGDPLDANRDKYGRLLRYIYLEDGTFVNAWMVQHGYAFAYTIFPFMDSEKFVGFERTARADELGLWNSSVCPYYKTK